MRTELTDDCDLNIITTKDPQGSRGYQTYGISLWLKPCKTFPDAKVAIGPSIDTGFYYDFDHAPFSREDLDAIEAEMKRIIRREILLRDLLCREMKPLNT